MFLSKNDIMFSMEVCRKRRKSMKYDLFTNGVDSLKNAHNCIEKLPDLKEGIEHNVKDAILSLNHALETLFKYILKQEREYLIFNNIDSYMKAKEAMITQKKENVFEVKGNLNTIGLEESIRRLRLLCDYQIDTNIIASTNYLIEVRNKLQHYELVLEEGELEELLEKLKSCYELSVEFLEEHLEDLHNALEEARFEVTHEDYWDDYAADMAFEMYREERLMGIDY